MDLASILTPQGSNLWILTRRELARQNSTTTKLRWSILIPREQQTLLVPCEAPQFHRGDITEEAANRVATD